MLAMFLFHLDNMMPSHIIIVNERTLMIMGVESEGHRDLAVAQLQAFLDTTSRRACGP